MKSNLIRFDWAAKRLLRQKSNFVVLEGFLSTLLKEDIHIVRILESESNKENAADKYYRIDMLAENSNGEQIIVEVRNDRELAYFHRMLYGVSKEITEYVKEEEYAQVKKFYLVNIVYFDLGQGEDYVYHGRTEFTGLHKNDVLKLSERQQAQFTCRDAGDLFIEYYILRVSKFNENVVTLLDEWILFLKTINIPDNATAKGLPEARECLRRDRLDWTEQKSYEAHIETLRYQKSVIQTSLIEGRAKGIAEGLAERRAKRKAEDLEKGRAEGLEKGLAEGTAKTLETIVITSSKAGFPIETIAKITGYTTDKVSDILKRHSEPSK